MKARTAVARSIRPVIEDLEVRQMLTGAAPFVDIGSPTGPDGQTLTDNLHAFYRYEGFDSNPSLSLVHVSLTRDSGGGPVEVFAKDYSGSDFAQGGAWLQPTTLPLDPYGLGTFKLTVTATDTAANGEPSATTVASKSVTIVDDDSTPPSALFTDPSATNLSDGVNEPFRWIISPDSVAMHVVVTRDGAVIHDRTVLRTDADWAANLTYSFDFGDQPGTYTASVTVTDDDNDRPNDGLTATVSKTVFVTDDDTTPPVVTFTDPSATNLTDGVNEPFGWIVSPDTTVMHVVVTRNGSVIHDRAVSAGGPGWAANGAYSFDFGNELGTYVCSVTVTDNDNDRPGDATSATYTKTVTTTDDDTTPPGVTFTDPSATNLTDGVNEPFGWIVSPDTTVMHVVVTRNGSVIHDRTVTAGGPGWAANGAYSFDFGNELGTYVCSVTVTDNDNDRPNDSLSATFTKTVVTTDDDTTAPSGAFSEPSGSPVTDGATQPFKWTISPDSSSMHVVVTRDGTVVHDRTVKVGDADWSLNYGYSYDYGTELGTYVATVTVVDNDNDRPNDSLSASFSRSVTVIDDDTTGPEIAFFTPTNTTVCTLDDTQPFKFTVIDSQVPSQPDTIHLVLTRDNGSGPVVVLDQMVDAHHTTYAGEVHYVQYGAGTYVLTVTATNDDNDRPNDAQTTTLTKSVVAVVCSPTPTPTPTTTITGKKYLDVTGNGLSADDTLWTTGLPTVTIKLYKDAGTIGVLDAADSVYGTTTVLSNGTYSFTNLPLGKYLVQEVVPTGYLRTAPVFQDYAGVAATASQSYAGPTFANVEKCGPDDYQYVKYYINGSTTPVTDLRGMTHQGDTVKVVFTVPAGHEVHHYAFVTYTAPGAAFDANTASQQKIYDLDEADFGPGQHSLVVTIPKCYYQIDFVCGYAIDKLGPAGSNIFYTPQQRLVSADNGGTVACTTTTCPGGSISGIVFVDQNDDGEIDFGEQGIKYVQVKLTNEQTGAVFTQQTDAYGAYEFKNLPFGDYTLEETTPAGYLDGKDAKGNGGGSAVVAANDKFSKVRISGCDDDNNWNFGERLAAGAKVAVGQTATIGFWAASRGQALIKCLNGSSTSTQLGNWLADQFPNLFGASAGSENNLTGKSNAYDASYFITQFKVTSLKIDAQVLAVALAVYVTDSGTAGTVAAQYGFKVDSVGVGNSTFNIGSNGAAFGVANNTVLTVNQILAKTDAMSAGGNYDIYNGSLSLQTLAYNVYYGINDAGDIV